MTSIQSLMTCASADVTWDRVRALVDQGQPESLILEYKRGYARSVPRTVAAMANSYGGLILVGVVDAKDLADDPAADRIPGVPGEVATSIANSCSTNLEPPWQPEILPVAVPGAQDLFVLVVRIDPARSPRPILVSGAAPIRLHGGTTVADRARLAQLFAEQGSQFSGNHPPLPRPQMPRDSKGAPAADSSCTAASRSPSAIRRPAGRCPNEEPTHSPAR